MEQGGEEAVALKVHSGQRAQATVADQVQRQRGENAVPKKPVEVGLQGGVGDGGVAGQHGGDDLLILLRFEGTCGVEQAPARSQTAEGRTENLALTESLAGQVRRLKPVTDLWIAAQRPSPRRNGRRRE